MGSDNQAKLSREQVDEIVARYDGGRGESPPDLADAYHVAASSIRYHLKQREVYNPNAANEALTQSDEDLGIGEAGGTNDMAQIMALLENPAMKKLLDAAVAQRITQLGLVQQQQPQQPLNQDALQAFTKSLEHMIEVQSMQQAGYIKPLSAAEVDHRSAGLVEMRALLKDFEAKGMTPEWIVGESGFFECTNALEFLPGQTIRTYLPPVEDFVPNNEAARKVHQAMLQWIGGPTPGIGEQVESAMRAANQSAPLVTGTLTPDASANRPVQLVERPAAAAQGAGKGAPRRRVAGTVVPERHDVSMAERAAGPQGPMFVADRATG